MADAAELNAPLTCDASKLKCALLKCAASKLKCAASKLPNLRQLTGLQSCERSVFELAGVGMVEGTCISTDSV